MKDFRRLDVWELSHRLVLDVYRATASFPRDELYGVVSQLRRACASIPTNIAEGCGRDGDAELGRFLQIAMGSASEVEYLLILARDLAYLSVDEYDRLTADLGTVRRMLNALIQRTRSEPRKRSP